MRSICRPIGVMAIAVTLLGVPALASGDVLYDQADHAAPPNATSTSPDFSPSNFFAPGSEDRTADDFTVPTGQTWSINEVDVGGAYNSTPANPQVNALIYADGGGRPGGQLFNQGPINATGGPNYAVPLSAAPALAAGTYWVVVQQVVSTGGYWSWTTRTAQSGSPAQWNSSAGAGSCLANTWNPRATCWPPSSNLDQVFLLKGTKTLPSNAFSLRKPKLNKQKGTATIAVGVPGPGNLVLGGKGVVAQRPAQASASKAVTAAGTVKLLVKAKGKAKKKLNSTGKAKVKAKVTFTPTNGAPATQRKSITLKKKLG